MTSKFDELLQEIEDDAVSAPMNLDALQSKHRLVFLKGRAKNFRSIGNRFIETDYTANSSTLIISDENGAGKSSSTVWLIYYALTGQPYFNKEKVNSLINSTTRKEMVVELEFMMRGVVYKIVRGRKPDIFELYVMGDDGWKQYKADASKDTLQDYIWALLGLEPKSGAKIIENACILGRERFQPFLTMSAEERRLMVESVWDLGIFRHMTEVGKNKISECKGKLYAQSEEIKEARHKVEQKSRDVEHEQRELERDKERVNQTVRDGKVATNQLEDKLVEARSRLDKLHNEGDAAVAARRSEIENEISELQAEESGLVEKFKTALEAKMGEVGKQNAEHEFNIKEYQRRIAEEQDKLEAIRDNLNSATKSAEDFETRLGEIQKKLQTEEESLSKARSFEPSIKFDYTNAVERVNKFENFGECPTCEQRISSEKLEAVRAETAPIISDSKAKLDKLEAVIKDKTESISKIREHLKEVADGLSEVRKRVNDFNEDIRRAEREISNLEHNVVLEERALVGEDQLAAFKSNLKDKETSERSQIEARIAVLRGEVTKLESGASEEEKRLNQAIEHLEQQIQQSKATASDNVQRASEAVSTREKHIEELQLELVKLEKEVGHLEQHYNSMEKELEEYQFAVDVLGEKEGKADVVRLYLPYLNAKINEYLEGMNISIGIELDEQFNATMNDPVRNGQTLFSLSTGQRARVDLAIIFALRDVASLKASFHTNLLILDESLENLSGRGVTEAITMIKQKFSSFNLFMITQRNAEFLDHFDHVIKYGLRGDETVVLNG